MFEEVLGTLEHHFNTIGLVGMNEALLNFIGEDIGSRRGRKFALEVMDFMREKLIKILDGRIDNEVYIRADKTISYGLVVRVMSEIKAAGVEKIGMVTEPVENNSPKLKADGK